jgi:hypothetical protein
LITPDISTTPEAASSGSGTSGPITGLVDFGSIPSDAMTRGRRLFADAPRAHRESSVNRR